MLSILWLLALSAPGANPRNPELPNAQEASPAACLPVLTDLGYPAAALANRISGSVTTGVEIDSNGNATRLEPKGHPLLAAGAQEALRTARFNRACWGQTVVMRFNFRIDQALDPGTPVSVKAASPFEYEISVPATVIDVTIYDPKWIFTRKGRFLHKVRTWLSKLRFWRIAGTGRRNCSPCRTEPDAYPTGTST